MARKAWFCYELGVNGIYSPVIYWDELPKEKKRGKTDLPFQVGLVEITDMEPDENNPPFSELTRIYHRPEIKG